MKVGLLDLRGDWLGPELGLSWFIGFFMVYLVVMWVKGIWD